MKTTDHPSQCRCLACESEDFEFVRSIMPLIEVKEVTGLWIHSLKFPYDLYYSYADIDHIGISRWIRWGGIPLNLTLKQVANAKLTYTIFP